MKKNKLEGWYGPMSAVVTPFDEGGKIIESSFRTLLHSYVEDGVSGILVGGHNGEAWALKSKELEHLVKIAAEEVGKEVKILCGIEGMKAEDIVEEAKVMAGLGAQAIVVEPPYVVTTATDPEIIDRFERIANHSPIPVILYNIPRRTQISIKPAVVAELAKHENIVGVKESTRDFAELTSKIELAGKDLSIFVGPASLILPGILFGAKGFIASGPMDLMRKDGRKLYDLSCAGRVQEALPLQFTATKIYYALMGLGTWPAALKAGLNFLGRPAGIPRLPVHPLGPKETAQLKKTLQEVGILS
jgi:4-hydroxy-tetrahydrodipicolinate synthase